MAESSTTEASSQNVSSSPCHDDIAADVLSRILTAPLADDPLMKTTDKEFLPIHLNVEISFDEIKHICKLAERSFLDQSSLIVFQKSELPLTIVGDMHGQVTQALRIFRLVGTPTENRFLFLGDYVDRGVQGIELVLLLFCLKIRYPTKVFLLRGNHEDVNPSLNYGFFDECVQKCGGVQKERGLELWKSFMNAFNCMPMAALIGGRIFACHGGISPEIEVPKDVDKIQRPSIIPPFGAMCDLVWADPTTIDGWVLSHRGISFNFGENVVYDYCKNNGLDLVLRAHQIYTEMYKTGYKMRFNGRLFTMFSAPNYMNYKNNSCVITVSDKMTMQFSVFRMRHFIGGADASESRAKRKKKPNSPNSQAPEPQPKSGDTSCGDERSLKTNSTKNSK